MNLAQRAFELGASKFGKSKKKDKRFYVVYNGKKIHFGLKNGSTFIDHHDKRKQKAWKERHSKIKLKDGSLAYKSKTQPSYWSWTLLWN